jgi:hypothetical protein
MPTFDDDGNMIDSMAQFDLLREIEESEKSKPWKSGHTAKTLFKKHDLRVVLITMENRER